MSVGTRVLQQARFGFVDIGARAGLPKYWEAMGPLLDVVAFEPDTEEAARLASLLGRTGARISVVPSAVWNTTGRERLYLTRSPGCSSLYRPRTEFLAGFPAASRFDIVSDDEVDTVLLDDAVRGLDRAVRFIKIDAQGGALNILQGATATLGETLGLEIEVELVPMYEGEPLFGEVDAFVRSREFELVDLRPTYWRREAGRAHAGTRGQIIFCDTLYLRGPDAFARLVASVDDEIQAQLCASAVLICEVYGLVDWAAAYAAALHTVGRPSGALSEYVAAHRRQRLPSFPLRYHLGLWLKDQGDRLIEAAATWGVAEQRLGSKPRLGRNLPGRVWRRLTRPRQRTATR